MNGETVVVVRPGVYADPDFRALPFAYPGETITVAGGWYAESLISDGMAARPELTQEEPPVIVDPVITVEEPPVIQPAALPEPVSEVEPVQAEPTKRSKK